jgi:hypothetical protein
MYTEKQRDLTGRFHFKVYIEDYVGLSNLFEGYRCQHFGHENKVCNFFPKYDKSGENSFPNVYQEPK